MCWLMPMTPTALNRGTSMWTAKRGPTRPMTEGKLTEYTVKDLTGDGSLTNPQFITEMGSTKLSTGHSRG